MTDLPSGAVVFLFTDIEGSTGRWESNRKAMSAALARHDAIMRTSIEAHRGVVFKTVGDAFCAAFASVSNAATAALDAQKRLAQEDWAAFGPDFEALRVRMAIHAGEAEQRSGDFFGPTLNRVARLLAAGHGGQILGSRAAKALLDDARPEGLTLHDLGEHRLKDLRATERIYQLAAPGLSVAFPPLDTLDARPHNLPQRLDSFVGRQTEIARLRDLLCDPTGPRLVTLTGIGGTGKTRLAIQAAAELIDRFDHGVSLVELAPLTAGNTIPNAVASALALFDEPEGDPVQSLVDQLAQRRLLLILDNCEHLVDAAAELTHRLLRACPRLRILATSREALALEGEQSFPLEPLTVPPAGPLSVAALVQSEAARLFIDRAVAAHPDFKIDAATTLALAEICRRLDGIPLAIELAAARVRALPVERIASLLDDRFRLLAGKRRGVPDRQQTLRAAIDWSHDLLESEEQSLLRRLAVFHGGWSLEAAQAVCAGAELADWAIVDLLASLVDKSLVLALEADGEARYRFLETIRAYARERLDESGERPLLRERHARYHLVLAEAAAPELRGADSEVWNHRIGRDHDNLRAALTWSLESPECGRLALHLAEALSTFWADFGHGLEAGQWLDRVLSSLPEPRDALDARAWSRCLYWQAFFNRWRWGEDRTVTALNAAMRALRACAEGEIESYCHNDLGLIALRRGDLRSALAHQLDGLALRRIHGAGWLVAHGLGNIAEIQLELGDLDAAAETCAEALALLDSDGGMLTVRPALHLQRGDVRLESGDVRAARHDYADALQELSDIGTLTYREELLARMAWVAVAEGRWQHAARLLGAAEGQFEPRRVRDSAWLITPRRCTQAEASAKAALGEEDFDAARAAGRALDPDEALAEALDIGKKEAADARS